MLHGKIMPVYLISHKNDLIEFLLQGRDFILFCLLCYKTVCLFTTIKLVRN